MCYSCFNFFALLCICCTCFCIFAEKKNITSLNHRRVLVTKWTKIIVVLRFFFFKIYLRNVCIANTKTHLPFTDLYWFLKIIFPINSFVGFVLDFNTLLNLPASFGSKAVCLLTFIIWKLHMHWYYWSWILSDQQ